MQQAKLMQFQKLSIFYQFFPLHPLDALVLPITTCMTFCRYGFHYCCCCRVFPQMHRYQLHLACVRIKWKYAIYYNQRQEKGKIELAVNVIPFFSLHWIHQLVLDIHFNYINSKHIYERINVIEYYFDLATTTTNPIYPCLFLSARFVCLCACVLCPFVVLFVCSYVCIK